MSEWFREIMIFSFWGGQTLPEKLDKMKPARPQLSVFFYFRQDKTRQGKARQGKAGEPRVGLGWVGLSPPRYYITRYYINRKARNLFSTFGGGGGPISLCLFSDLVQLVQLVLRLFAPVFSAGYFGAYAGLNEVSASCLETKL